MLFHKKENIHFAFHKQPWKWTFFLDCFVSSKQHFCEFWFSVLGGQNSQETHLMAVYFYQPHGKIPYKCIRVFSWTRSFPGFFQFVPSFRIRLRVNLLRDIIFHISLHRILLKQALIISFF